MKQLASQTARATEEVGTQIAAIQGATAQAVQSVRGIAAIADAIEQQRAATQQIAGNVAEAAAGTTEVSAGISGAVDETTASPHALRQTAGEVAGQGAALRQALAGLLDGLRAA